MRVPVLATSPESVEKAMCNTSELRELRILSLQPFDKVEVGEGSMIAIDVGLAVGRHSNGADPFDAGGIRRHELPPKGSRSRRQVQPKQLGGQVAGTIDVEGVPVQCPFYRLFSSCEAG